jgi:hypothetical protein
MRDRRSCLGTTLNIETFQESRPLGEAYLLDKCPTGKIKEIIGIHLKNR